jgi:hypothetical protein
MQAAAEKRGPGRPPKPKASILPALRPNASEMAERGRGGKKVYDATKFRVVGAPLGTGSR